MESMRREESDDAANRRAISSRKRGRWLRDEHLLPILLSVIAVQVGALLRLGFVLSSDFPLNDGGLFYVMIQDLIRSHYALPVYTSYNSANIPFAYPPLPFYIAAFFAKAFKWPILEILRLFPAIASILTVPAFCALSRAMLKSRSQSAFAVLAFAMLPRSFLWHIVGGGLTRSLGFLFATLTLRQAYLLYTSPRRWFLLTTVLCAGLAILCHPEKAWCAAFGAGIMFLFVGRNRRGIRDSLLVTMGATGLVMPWLGAVVARHGLAPLVSAAQTGGHSWYSWLPILTFGFLRDCFTGVLPVVGVLGVLVCARDRELLLPIWLLAIWILQPRTAATFSTIPLAMLVGIGVDRVILPLINARPAEGSQSSPLTRFGGEVEAAPLRSRLHGVLPVAVLCFLLVNGIVSALSVGSSTGSPLRALGQGEQEAMEWVAAMTPKASRFLVITPTAQWPRDATSEWFPALAQRVSLDTVQGSEWLPDREYEARWERYQDLQRIYSVDEAGLEHWAREADLTFTHVYVSKTKVEISPGQLRDPSCSLRYALQTSPHYIQVYDGPGATVFARVSS